MRPNPKILLVEDNHVTSRTISLFLTSEKYEVCCAFDGNAGIAMFQEQVVDLVMLDLMLPDIDGLDVCRTIRSSSSTPIIILTAKSTEDEIVAGLECGADDYVCKPFGAKELLARVRRCLNRIPSKESGNSIRVGALEMNLERRVLMLAGTSIKLTKSEFDVLAVLIRQPGRVFTRAQLIQQALGINFEGFDRTIDTHIWSLRKKLGEPRGNPKYIQSELGVGYRMSDHHAQ